MGFFDNQQKNQRFIQEVMNMQNWVKTRKLKTNVWAALPNIGTKFKDGITNEIKATTSEKPLVINGLLGDIQIISEEELYKDYTFSNGRPITPYQLDNREINGKIEWFQVETKKDDKIYWAFLVSVGKYGESVKDLNLGSNMHGRIVNRSGVKHAFGDILICEDIQGIVNLNTLNIINGQLFLRMYDTENMQESVKSYVKQNRLDLNRYADKPQHKVIEQIDIKLKRKKIILDELQQAIEEYYKQLDKQLYLINYETNHFDRAKIVIQSTKGYTLGFIITVQSGQYNMDEIQYVKMFNKEILNKAQSKGTLNIKEFIGFIDKEIRR